VAERVDSDSGSLSANRREFERKPSSLSRGTGGSNPACSTSESNDDGAFGLFFEDTLPPRALRPGGLERAFPEIGCKEPGAPVSHRTGSRPD